MEQTETERKKIGLKHGNGIIFKLFYKKRQFRWTKYRILRLIDRKGTFRFSKRRNEFISSTYIF